MNCVNAARLIARSFKRCVANGVDEIKGLTLIGYISAELGMARPLAQWLKRLLPPTFRIQWLMLGFKQAIGKWIAGRCIMRQIRIMISILFMSMQTIRRLRYFTWICVKNPGLLIESAIGIGSKLSFLIHL